MCGQKLPWPVPGHTVAPVESRAYHVQAYGHQTLPLLAQGVLVLAEEGLPQHEGQQGHEAKPHVA